MHRYRYTFIIPAGTFVITLVGVFAVGFGIGIFLCRLISG
jgi:hypothetical protein